MSEPGPRQASDLLPRLAQEHAERRHAGGRGRLLLVLVALLAPPADAAHPGAVALLREVLAGRLRANMRGDDLVIQRGEGGEFLLALVDCLPEEAAMRLSKLLDTVSSQPVEAGGAMFDVILAAGAAILADGLGADEAAQRAGIDAAILRATAALASARSRDRGTQQTALVFDGVETIAGHRFAAG